MANRSYDLYPRFEDEDEIDAEIVDAEISVVGDSGYAHVDPNHEHHLVAWAPFRHDGQLKTTTYNQQRKEHVQSYVQKSDGGVNIGTEEWAGERVIVLILDETLDE